MSTGDLSELKVKLKLDLHVHIFEQFLPVAPRLITVSSVSRLIDKIKSAGLDGVAITEHDNKEFGYRVKEIVDTQFGGEVVIIPGREVEEWSIHYVELDLAADGKTTFRFLAHPGYPSNPDYHINGFNGIEIENGLHNWHIDKAMVRSIAEKHNLILLSNSDAHYLRDVGKCYTEIALEDLDAKINYNNS
jgi:PHP family Zn ribbon phosphoesterase